MQTEIVSIVRKTQTKMGGGDQVFRAFYRRMVLSVLMTGESTVINFLKCCFFE